MKHLAFLLLALSSASLQAQPGNPSAPSGEIVPEAIRATMQTVADWQLAQLEKHPQQFGEESWILGALYAGIMALDDIADTPIYHDAMAGIGKRFDWKPASRVYHADDYCVCQSWLELYLKDNDPAMLRPTKERFDFILAHRATNELPMNVRGSQDRWSWCDALFMGPPAWIRIYKATNDRRYLDFMDQEWWATSDFLYDTNEHLYFRDSTYFNKREANGAKIFWSRGNGWVMAGLARVLQFLPADHPNRPRYEQQFREMAAKIATLQQEDGLWRSSLLDAVAYPLKETSGSGFYTYALAWGINNGLLGRAKFEPVVRKSWPALVGCVTPEGRLEHVQPVGADPKKFAPDHTAKFGVGAFLLAGSEMVRLSGGSTASINADRACSVEVMTRVARPVLAALAEGHLREQLPHHDWERDRAKYTCLEAFGRTLAGIAPWLELGPDDTSEGQLRAQFIELAVKSLAHATDPQSPDFMNFREGGQPLVDAAFLAHGLLRAPTQLWGRLDSQQRSNVVAALKATRTIKPGENNWLLFSAIVEAALWQFTGECELKPIEHAVNRHLEWYRGDGVYGDGPEFHWDYYNSYVIQPMLLDVLKVCADKQNPLGDLLPKVTARARRYAAVQERLISPEGTFPVMGRSSAYRFGALQHLSTMALRHELPAGLKPGAVRSALTAVVRRMIEAPGTFDGQGWLNVGAVGHQQSIREGYIATGSLYLCLTGLVHLGLPANDPFWTEPASPWTQKRIWSGEDVPPDHAL